MNQYLKSYQVIMHTVGPVFIGNGKEITKKEYIFLNRKKIGIPDTHLLYKYLQSQNKAEAFEEYLLGKGTMDLTNWLQKQKIKPEEILPHIKYTLDCGDAIIERGSRRLQVMECIKDAYRKPYIPGSSLKGMFRTILLGADIISNMEKYQKAKDTLRRNAALRANRNNYLKKDITNIEGTAYRILSKNEKNPNDAVNDILQGFIVSDSEPLTVESLVLCQKVDRHPDGTEKHLPLLRECIKPETEIQFQITIDTSICNLTEKNLMDAVKRFMTSHYRRFAYNFTGLDAPKVNYVLCGGGSGFVSKTIVYPMFGKIEGLKLTQQIFVQTGVPKEHKHYRDKTYGASPHTIKCTQYKGKTLQMGMCKIKKIIPL